VSPDVQCNGLGGSFYHGHLYVVFEAIDPPGNFFCGAFTTDSTGPSDCSFNPGGTLISQTQAQACRASLKAIAGGDGVGCPF
jgi:hypothetical protein